MGRLKITSLPQSLSLDSNVFIAFNDPEHDFYTLTKSLFLEISQVNPRVFISVLVFEEFLVKYYQRKPKESLAYFENLLTGNELFDVVDVDRKIALKAAQIRAEYPKIKTPDAIHLACAIEAGARVFITTDKGLPSKIESLEIVSLKDLNIR